MLTLLVVNHGYRCKETDERSGALEQIFAAVISDSRTDLETSLVAGTSWAKIVVFESDDDTSAAGKRLSETLRSIPQEDLKSIALVEGIFNCGTVELLVVNEFALFEETFQRISSLTNRAHAQSFQNFHSLKALTTRLLELTRMEPEDGGSLAWKDDLKVRLSAKSAFTKSVQRIVSSNWENPLRGVCEIVSETFEYVLELCRSHDPDGYRELLTSLATSNMVGGQESWKSKSRYLPLTVLLPRYGPGEALSEFPALPANLATSLSANHIVAHGATVYRVVLRAIDFPTWQSHFLKVCLKLFLRSQDLTFIPLEKGSGGQRVLRQRPRPGELQKPLALDHALRLRRGRTVIDLDLGRPEERGELRRGALRDEDAASVREGRGR